MLRTILTSHLHVRSYYQLVINRGHRPTQAIIGQLCIFSKMESVWVENIQTWNHRFSNNGTNEKRSTYSSVRPRVTKYGEVVTYGEENPSTNSHDPIIPWSREFKWSIKNVIPSLLQDIWQKNVTQTIL